VPTSSASAHASEDVDFVIDIDVDGDEDVDSHRGSLHRLRRRQEQAIDMEGMKEGDVDEEVDMDMD
jgi:hypothetical protein